MALKNHNLVPQELFILATHQFPKRGCPIPNWKVALTETYHKEGLIATYYSNASNHTALMVFQLFGVDEITPTLLECASEFARGVKNNAKIYDYHLAYSGYGKGGSIAESCAIKDKLKAYTFDSEPIFDKSPQNSYINLNRYFSNDKQNIIYGNMYTIQPFANVSKNLKNRFEGGLKKVPIKFQNHHQLDGWSDVFNEMGLLKRTTLVNPKPTNMTFTSKNHFAFHSATQNAGYNGEKTSASVDENIIDKFVAHPGKSF